MNEYLNAGKIWLDVSTCIGIDIIRWKMYATMYSYGFWILNDFSLNWSKD